MPIIIRQPASYAEEVRGEIEARRFGTVPFGAFFENAPLPDSPDVAVNDLLP
jgi:hypothetical protein